VIATATNPATEVDEIAVPKISLATDTAFVTKISLATKTDIATATKIDNVTDTVTNLATITPTIIETPLATLTKRVVTATLTARGPTPTVVLQAMGGSVPDQYAELINTIDGQDYVIQFDPPSLSFNLYSRCCTPSIYRK
jgi:hypothetical protein